MARWLHFPSARLPGVFLVAVSLLLAALISARRKTRRVSCPLTRSHCRRKTAVSGRLLRKLGDCRWRRRVELLRAWRQNCSPVLKSLEQLHRHYRYFVSGPCSRHGVVIRSNDESRGVDAYNGYFVGLRSLDGTLVMGRASYSWLEVLPVSIPGGVHPFTWYRLRVTAYACNIGASVANLSTQQTAWIAFQEHFCIKSGRFGLRTLNANAEWRNVRVEPASWKDYDDLEQHAGFVQHPVIVNGPPWWTPWHVGVLFMVRSHHRHADPAWLLPFPNLEDEDHQPRARATRAGDP